MSINLTSSSVRLFTNRFENTISKLVLSGGQEVAGWLSAIGIVGTAIVAGGKKLNSRKKQQREQQKRDKLRQDFNDQLPDKLDAITKALEEIQKQTASMPDIAADVAILSALDTLDRERQGILWYRCDQNGVTTQVSEQLCQLFGVTEDMMIKDGTGWLTVVENPTAVYDEWMRSVRERIPYHSKYYIYNRHTKTRCHVKTNAIRIESPLLKHPVYYGEVEVID